jgi:hypothetical protein
VDSGDIKKKVDVPDAKDAKDAKALIGRKITAGEIMVNVPFEKRLRKPSSIFYTNQTTMALSKLCLRSIKTFGTTIRPNFLNGDTIFGARSKWRVQSLK